MTALASLDATYFLYLFAIAVDVTLELVALQWLHLTTSTLLPLALVLQSIPRGTAIARTFTFSRHGLTAQTTRRAFLSGLMRFGAFFFTYLALTTTNGAASQPVYAAQFHFFIHALRLLISHKRSLVRWNAAVIIIIGLACITMTQHNPNAALAHPEMSPPALAVYLLYMRIKLCCVPIACLLAAQVCEISLGEQELAVRDIVADEWGATGTLALVGFTCYTVALPLLQGIGSMLQSSSSSSSSSDYSDFACLALVLLAQGSRRWLLTRLVNHLGQPSDFELSSIVNLVSAFAVITTLFFMPSGIVGLRHRVLAAVCNIFMMAGAMAITADTTIEARCVASEKRAKKRT